MRRDRPFLVQREADVQSLVRMDASTLRALYRRMFESDPPAGNTEHARRRLAWHMQAAREGGLPESARQHALGIAAAAIPKATRSARVGATSTVHITSNHDSRMPMPGTLLTREYRGRRILVRVVAGGFEWEGQHYTSLSVVARAITGTKWNGYVFFGLAKGAADGPK